MTISYVQAANPIWYIADLTGLPAGGGSIVSRASQNPDELLPIFQDTVGTPYPDPLLINMNGTVGPLYFEVDSSNPDNNYYLQVLDSDGNIIWTNPNFTPPSGSGGSSTSVTYSQNLVTNNVMYRNITTSAMPLPAFLTIAPGANKGLAAVATPTPAHTDFGAFGPDINFIKNNTSAADQITFVPFTPGDQLTGDVCPYDYFNYSCTNTPTGETYKYIQFPITNKVQSFQNQSVSVSLWIKDNTGGATIDLSFVQFFGDGNNGPSSPQVSAINTLTSIGSTFTKSISTATVLGTSGFVVGHCGNDGLFLQIGLPLNSPCNISFTKPAVFLGSLNPPADYQTYDMIEAVTSSPRTGDIRVSENLIKTYGWVPMNDGVIGNLGIAPIDQTVTRANLDTFPLYNLIWNLFVINQTLAPMYNNSSASPISYTNAVTDFCTGNSISLTKQAGRLLAAIGTPSSGNITGTNWLQGVVTGGEQSNEVSNHTHPATSTSSGTVTITGGGGSGANVTLTSSSTANNETFNLSVSTSTTVNNNNGGVSEQNIQNPVNYRNVYIKL